MKRQIPPEYLRHLEPRSAPGAAGVTLRAIVAGALISAAIGAGLPYSNMIIRGGLLAHNFNTPAAVFSFFLFVGAINVALGLVRRTWEFGRGELATVYIMALLATAIPTVGFSENLLPIIAGLRYYAAPENGWTDSFLPHLPTWLVPTDAEAIRGFYEGSPGGVPWAAWATPVAAWCVFILAVYWVSACVLVILRQQWMERERLLYPLAQVPLALLQQDSSRSRFPPFFRNRIMWAGFAVPMLIGSFHSLHAYFPQFPDLSGFAAQGPMSMRIFLFGMPVVIMLNLGLVGFTYLISRDVSLGLWFFFLVATVQRSLFQIVGLRRDETLSRFANLSGPFLAHQAMGAMIVLVLSGLWIGRQHLRRVLQRAIARDAGADDIDEVMSFRVAVFGGLAGVAVLSGWLWLSGLPWWVIPVFLFAVFIIFTAMTRAIVEGGVAVLRTPLTPADFVVSGLGSSLIGTAGAVSLGLTYVWAANLRLFFMPCFANALKIAEEIGRPRRRLMWAVVISVLLSLAASIWCILHLSYAHGGVNLHKFWFLGVPRGAGNYVQQLMAPTEASLSGWLFTGVGAVVMTTLIWLRSTLLWWPLHPLGFAVSTFHIMSYVWFSILVSWSIKSVVLRLGGPALFRSTRPFFLGLIMGQVFVTGMWLVIDYFNGVSGNQPIGGSFV